MGGLAERGLARLAAWAIRALGATWRLQVVGDGGIPRARLHVGWHAHWVVGAWLFRDRDLAVGISRSRDGDLAAAVLRELGYADPPRGSSSRGGAGLLLRLSRRLRAGEPVGIFPDGPRGPAEVAKAGVASLARLSEAPITPFGAAARPALRLGSWDRTLVPLPFARVALAVGAAMPVGRNAAEADEARIARDLTRELARLTRDATAALDSAP